MANPEYAAISAASAVAALDRVQDALAQAYDDLRTLSEAIRDIDALVDKPFKTHTDVSVAHICRLPAIQNAMSDK